MRQRTSEAELATGVACIVGLCYVARKMPAPGRYRLAGYVHASTYRPGGDAPLHQHLHQPDSNHVAMYESVGGDRDG